MHKQHIGDAVQEGQLRGWQRHLSGGDQIRSEVRGRFLEQQPFLHDAVSLYDDDELGDCLRCLVFAADDADGGRERDRFRQPGEERHRETGRTGRFSLVSFKTCNTLISI